MNWDKIFEKIEFDVKVDNLEDVFQRFQKYIHEDDNEYTLDGYTLQTYMMSEKVNETDAEVSATRGTRRTANRAERRKATAHAKNRRKALAVYSDDEIRTNSGKVVDSGIRSYEKGAKIYTRKGRATREKFTGEPFNPWDDEDYWSPIDHETDLDIPVGTGYWSDETLSEAINNYNDPFYDPYDCDDYDDELEEVLVDDDDEDFCLDVDGGNFYTHETAIQKHCKELHEYNNQLEEEVRKLHEFLSDFNLETLHNYWEETHK